MRVGGRFRVRVEPTLSASNASILAWRTWVRFRVRVSVRVSVRIRITVRVRVRVRVRVMG